MPKKAKSGKDKTAQATVGTAELSKPDKGVSPTDRDDMSGPSSQTRTPKAVGPRLRALFDIAEIYGQRSFRNYAQIRSVAETIRDGFCAFLNSEGPCVFLVPPKGRFAAQNYQSAAFSVTGQGYLPLTPISFGLAVLVSEDKDYVRLVLTCRKEGDTIYVRIENGVEIRLNMPLGDDHFAPVFDALYQHLIDYFQDQIDDYDNGDYGVQEIGFDIQRMNS